jgi:pyridinium-3,5-biscarboxylic acid mononucleotide synthase
MATLAGQAGSGELAHARPDFTREDRKGVPEVILAARKTPDQVVSITRAFLETRGRAIISRVLPDLQTTLRDTFPEADVQVYPLSEMVVIRRKDQAPPVPGGRVGIITAGTSDMPVAEQAAVIAREMGCDVVVVSDVGVAGIHRLFQPLQNMLAESVDAIVVAAGMDGALPSVVAGLVDVPVIGLPTSTGYGYGGQGTAALMSMLQTCSPGLAVVNIDNGVGAGATAGLIANRVARVRAGT